MSNDTPFKITNGTHVYSPRYMKTGKVIMTFPEYRQASVDFGDKLPYIVALSDLEPATIPKPTRLAKAKAALEVETKQHWYALERLNRAIAERDAAEKEAAALATIPPLLLEVAREVEERNSHAWFGDAVIRCLARSHGIAPATLRAALEVAP